MNDIRRLIIQAQRGDPGALNQLFSQWYRHVYNIAYRYFADADTAAEVSQQTFLTIQQKLNQLKDPSGFRLWLYRTVVNLCHNEARQGQSRRRTREGFAANGSLPPVTRPDELYQRQERSRLVLAALQSLPAEQRSVIIMKEYEGLKFREIAELLELSENTVKSRLYYGLQGMRKFFLTTNLEKEVYHE